MVRVGSQVGSGWPAQNTGQVTGQPVFASGQKKSGSGWVGSGQKILTRFAMSTSLHRLAHFTQVTSRCCSTDWYASRTLASLYVASFFYLINFVSPALFNIYFYWSTIYDSIFFLYKNLIKKKHNHKYSQESKSLCCRDLCYCYQFIVHYKSQNRKSARFSTFNLKIFPRIRLKLWRFT